MNETQSEPTPDEPTPDEPTPDDEGGNGGEDENEG